MTAAPLREAGMPDHQPPPAPVPPDDSRDASSRQLLLVGLAQALKLLAERVLPQANTATEVGELAARAEVMAATAWRLGAALIPDPDRVQALQAEFRSFIAEATALSARAARAAVACREATDTLGAHAAEMTGLANAPGTPDLATLRALLRPVVTSLEQLPDRVAASEGLADDVAALGHKAAALREQALAAEGRRRSATEAMVAIYRTLMDFAVEAAGIGQTMMADAERLRSSIGGVAIHASRLASPSPSPTGPAPNANAEARLGKVVTQGARIADRSGGALDWGAAARRA